MFFMELEIMYENNLKCCKTNVMCKGKHNFLTLKEHFRFCDLIHYKVALKIW